VRKAAEAEVARAYVTADDAVRQAEAQAAHIKSLQPLSIPVPPFEFRAETGHIESVLNALQQIDYVLEVGMADGGDAGIPLDIDLMQTLVWAVQEHARYLSDQSRIRGPAGSPPADAAAAYEQAAAESFRAFLQRIEDVARRLGGRDRSPTPRSSTSSPRCWPTRGCSARRLDSQS
jgi:colicin import membrane protein